jgi:hypothetical protein
VVPVTAHLADGTPALTFKCTWAPIALKPVVIWDLDGNPRLLSYGIKFAPHRGAPHSGGEAFGIWLSYYLRRQACWRHWFAIKDVATLAGISPHRVRNIYREVRDLPPALLAKRLHFSALEQLFLSCQLLPRDHQLREVPVREGTDPIDLQRFVLRLIEEPGFREQHEYLTPDEVSEMLRCSAQWLAKARVTGEGPVFIRRGRKILYRRTDVEDWLKSREMRSTRAAA